MGLTLRDWFWTNLDTTGGAVSCWPWRGAERGYHNVQWEGRTVPAHRLSYELAKGPIPDGMFICHVCDNPLCCNPDHLWAGTHKDNMDDMMQKGRWNGGRRMKADDSLLAVVNERLKTGESLTKIAVDIGTTRGALIRAFKASKTVKRTQRKPDEKGGRPALVSIVAIRQVFSQNPAATIDEVATTLGVSRAAIYRAFKRENAENELKELRKASRLARKHSPKK